MKLVLAILPKAGLGNKLYVWAQAQAFADLNQLRVLTLGWTRPSLGPLMRRERSSRLYMGQFRSPDVEDFFLLTQSVLLSKSIKNPSLETLSKGYSENQLFIFKGTPKVNPDNSFQDLKPFRESLKLGLCNILSAQIKKKLQENKHPVVGLHVRRGDFASTPWITPLDYFLNRVSQIRQVAGACLPVTVFSDGTDDELSPLLDMPEVKRAPSNPEIVDILLLSRSRILVTCPASTFSNWAAFLSDGIIIRDYLFPHKDARPQEINETFFEGIPGEDVGSWPALLIQNLRKLE